MLNGKRFSIILLFVFFHIVLSIPAYAKKSVYVVSDTWTSQLKVYEVDGAILTWQKDYTCQLDPGEGLGSVGIAIDESGYGQFLFVTFELSDEIELVNAKTMQYADTITAPGASNLAGIVFDSSKQKRLNAFVTIDLRRKG